MKLLFACLALFAFATLLPAQSLVSGCAGCAPSSRIFYPAQPAAQPAPRVITPEHPDEVTPQWWVHQNMGSRFLYLWQGDYRCLGRWDSQTETYTPFKTKNSRGGGELWIERSTNVPPLMLPPGYHTPQGTGEVGDVFGVDTSKLSKRDRYEINGVEVDRPSVVNRFRDELTDDSKAGHLTILAPDATRSRIMSDIASHPSLAVARSLRIQGYDPASKVAASMLATHRMDQDKRYQQSGVAILYQPPAGPDGRSPVTPIYGYTSPEALAEALRVVDPRYDPNKNKLPGVDVLDFPPEAWFALIIGAAILAFALLYRSQQGSK